MKVCAGRLSGRSFLSARAVIMTNGPEAEVGNILKIPFERPRSRKEIMERLLSRRHLRAERHEVFEIA